LEPGYQHQPLYSDNAQSPQLNLINEEDPDIDRDVITDDQTMSSPEINDLNDRAPATNVFNSDSFAQVKP
jgi:hypothetical protein